MRAISPTEAKRQEIQDRLAVWRQVSSACESLIHRERIASVLPTPTDVEIELITQSLKECVMAVRECQSIERNIQTTTGRLVIRGIDSDVHQSRIDKWNTPTDGRPPLAVLIYEILTERKYQI